MKALGAGMAWFVWQSSLLVNIGAVARPEHLRYQRSVQVASDTSGMACAVLDATVLGHTASAAHNDLRLFREGTAGDASEVPYTLTESGPEPVADAAVAVEHAAVRGNALSFDLQMPPRPFSEVRLHLRLKNFVATAAMEGRDGRGGRGDLGKVAVFDLSGEHLGQWTELLLAESRWPVLHVALTVRTPGGAAREDLAVGDVLGAEVPPSRLRQTRYVPTVSTGQVDQRGFLSVALLRVPAHVPVERVAFAMEPGFGGSFAREVTVSARADHEPVTSTEALDAGEILQVSLPSGDPGLIPIALKEDALDATLGATLARPATVLVAVNNEGRAALPIRSVTLEMRERKMCFFADRESRYVLRYGDAALRAPAYDESALAVPAEPLTAGMGPEGVNPGYKARRDARPFLRRHPELFWLTVLLSGGLMGGTALHHVQHRRVR